MCWGVLAWIGVTVVSSCHELVGRVILGCTGIEWGVLVWTGVTLVNSCLVLVGRVVLGCWSLFQVFVS